MFTISDNGDYCDYDEIHHDDYGSIHDDNDDDDKDEVDVFNLPQPKQSRQ